VPDAINQRTKIQFKLCHVNRLTSDTDGFSEWHDRLTDRHSPQKLPSFSTEISYVSNLFPKFDSQSGKSELNYEENMYTTKYEVKHRRLKT
jgi:hypothetical protein